MTTTEIAAASADLDTAALTARKENFARLFNPKLAMMMEKRDEVKRMADRPANFQGVITDAHVGRVVSLMTEISTDIMNALVALRDYVPTEGEPRPLRAKPTFDLFDM